MRSRKLVWAVVAILCAAAGVVGSVMGAHAVARNDTSTSRQTSQQTAAGIAASVKSAIRHEEDLAIGAATYFAGNSKTSRAEFATWVKWARTLRRFPELEGLGLVTLVHGQELAAFHAQVTGQPAKATESAKATGSQPATHTDGGLRSRSRRQPPVLLPGCRQPRQAPRQEPAGGPGLLRGDARAAGFAR